MHSNHMKYTDDDLAGSKTTTRTAQHMIVQPATEALLMPASAPV